MARESTKSPRGAVARVRRRARGRPVDQALHERRRLEILDKAALVFAEHGYPNTDVRFIAQPLGVSKGTVYRYFPSKERLFLAAVERGVQQLDARINDVLNSSIDPLEKLVMALRAYLRFFEEHPELVELFIQERAEFRGRKKPIYFEHGDVKKCPWADIVKGLMDGGRVRRMPVERLMDVLGDLAYGTMFTNYLTRRHKPFEQQARDIIDILFNGILTDVERKTDTNGNGHRQARRL